MSRTVTFGIVGGYGATGRIVASELGKSSDGEVLIGGRDVEKAGVLAAKLDSRVSAIAAQQLFGRGVKLRLGETIEYIITDSKSKVPNDRVRAYSLWEGWHGYDCAKYAAVLREAFEPFEQPCSSAE